MVVSHARAAPRPGLEARGAGPDLDKGVLHRLLRQARVAQEPHRDRHEPRPLAVEEAPHGGAVALRAGPQVRDETVLDLVHSGSAASPCPNAALEVQDGAPRAMSTLLSRSLYPARAEADAPPTGFLEGGLSAGRHGPVAASGPARRG
jgi:hypothetical protein